MAVPPPISSHPDKPALRAELRARRKAHVEALGHQGALDGATAAARLIVPHVPRGAIAALYLAMGDEMDPDPLLTMLVARGQPVALPALYDETAMDFRAWAPGDPIERGPFRLRQPPREAPLVSPDIIVLPMTGFDRFGGRIGQGKSHYDRALVRYPGARRIGLAWSVQDVAGRLPHDPWDQPLHAVATEAAFIPMPDVAG